MRFSILAALTVLASAAASEPVAALDVETTAPAGVADGVAPEDAPPAAPVETGSVETPEVPAAPSPVSSSPIGQGLRQILEAEAAAAPPAAPPAAGEPPKPKSAEERDRDAIRAFYAARNDEPIWVSDGRLTDKAIALAAEVRRAGDWGLDAGAFNLPALLEKPDGGKGASDGELAAAELQLSYALLKYHLLARGGTIYDAPKQISSYLDRRPQIRDRKATLEAAAAADDITTYLLAMHPQQPEFQRLHKAWLELKNAGAKTRGKVSSEQLLANMAMWRLMPEEMGEFHVWLNVPEYMIRLVDKGETVFNERVTVGLINKQTPIFSDAMERVTFRSRWRVPDSIKVREVWPSLLKGGGMMRQHGLVMTLKDSDEPVDWRKIDWTKADMNNYVLWQPPGGKNQLGLVKFSFPNKHYVFMHDTPDKHMFAWTRRANSHGCMRIRNPLEMATVILERDQGLTRDKVLELAKSGPDHNVLELKSKVPVHITYLTVRIDDSGRISTFPDIYGHEKRVRQALTGQWDKIAIGPDHLAPLDQTRVPRVAAGPGRGRALREPRTLTELMFGGN